MCGLSGYIAFKPQYQIDIKGMTDVIKHRGPDDEGYVTFQKFSEQMNVYGGLDTPVETYLTGLPYAPIENINSRSNFNEILALGHRRLSIVDLTPQGHQPMCTSDARFWIVYNGEIYNYNDLRNELVQLGHNFLSHSDTEVVLIAFREWGKECLNKLNGMFSFLIYDTECKTVFAARDRFGIKPLYYWVSTLGIAFASEIKQFTKLPGWNARVNGQRAYDFLNWGITDHTDETMFSGVYQLRPAQALQFSVEKLLDGVLKFTANERLPVYTWYKLKPQVSTGSMAEVSKMFQDMLIDSVRLRLQSDVPLGSCLSGGLDSSSIVCIVDKLLREQGAKHIQKTFSACADIEKFNERKWIDIVVNATNVDAHYVYPSLSGLFEETNKITWHQDEPFGSTSIYAQWKVFELAAKEQTKVMLDGQGADEQLAGYHGFFGPHLGALLRAYKFLYLLDEIRAMKRVHGYGHIRAIIYLAGALLPARLKDKLQKMTGRTSSHPSWFNFERINCEAINPSAAIHSTMARSVQSFSISQLMTSNLQMLLHWEDRDSMAHSIESRIPFLDYRLVEFILGLPDEYKLSDGITKRVLRKGMSGILPDEIRDRMDKKGFETPEETWLREIAPDLFRQKLSDAISASQGILRIDESKLQLEEMISGKRPFSFLPWRMISFGDWVNCFKVSV